MWPGLFHARTGAGKSTATDTATTTRTLCFMDPPFAVFSIPQEPSVEPLVGHLHLRRRLVRRHGERGPERRLLHVGILRQPHPDLPARAPGVLAVVLVT